MTTSPINTATNMADDNIIKVDLGGVPQMLRRAARRLDNTKPLMRELSEVLMSGVEDNFRRERGPDGPWVELKESTIRQREREGKWPGSILQRSAAGLAASVQPYHTASAAGVSTNRIYAALQQFGGESGMPPGPAAVPARPYLYLAEEAQTEVEATIEEYGRDAFSG